MFLIRLLHLTIFGFTGMLPLLGLATAQTAVRLGDALWLLALAFSFHCFAYLLNDVVDLPLDRTQPSRAHYPLVLGQLSAWQAVWLALIQIPLSLGLLWWRGASWGTFGWLLLAFGGLAIYDLWGKKTAVPPLTDLIQGVGWAALLMVGANGEPNRLTWLLFAYITVYILLINGVNASLRDLANDWRNGIMTTAVLLGARPDQPTPRTLRRYALFWQGVLLVVGLWLALALPLGSVVQRITAVLLTLTLMTTAFYLVQRMIHSPNPWYMLHIMLLLAFPILLFTLATPAPLRWLLPLTFCAPLLTADWLRANLTKQQKS